MRDHHIGPGGRPPQGAQRGRVVPRRPQHGHRIGRIGVRMRVQGHQLGRLPTTRQFAVQVAGEALRAPGPRIGDHVQDARLGHAPDPTETPRTGGPGSADCPPPATGRHDAPMAQRQSRGAAGRRRLA
ncbi:hypothetical protein GCM10010195_56930 [Kitasatospora griseola]|nr:hypothetical protein GCM10010195_56930 [Kitasatospora griseola]